MEKLIRLNKFISQSGVSSRRAADQLILDGHVSVNNKVVTKLGVQIDPDVDVVKVRGRPIQAAQEKLYLMFNKPKGVLTTLSDPEGRPTVYDYIEHLPQRVFPVGRLDWNTEGLLLFTNDGDFANKVIHPKSEVTKTYTVKVEGNPTPDKIEKLLKGVSIPGGKVRFKSIKRIPKKDTKHTWFTVVLTQGLNKQIRLMFERIGHDVLKLQRVAVGNLELGTLRRGEFKSLLGLHIRKVFQKETQKKAKKVRKKSTKRLD